MHVLIIPHCMFMNIPLWVDYTTLYVYEYPMYELIILHCMFMNTPCMGWLYYNVAYVYECIPNVWVDYTTMYVYEYPMHGSIILHCMFMNTPCMSWFFSKKFKFGDFPITLLKFEYLHLNDISNLIFLFLNHVSGPIIITMYVLMHINVHWIRPWL